MNEPAKLRGGASHKITADQTQEIRRLYLEGVSVRKIADEFDVGVTAVRYHCADLPSRTIPTDDAELAQLVNFPKPPGWMKDAACGNHPDPEVFFPSRPSGPGEGVAHQIYAQTLEYTKGLCASCPVRLKCLEYALALPPADARGIWAGTTDGDRERLRKKAAKRNAEANGRSRTMGNSSTLTAAQKTAPEALRTPTRGLTARPQLMTQEVRGL